MPAADLAAVELEASSDRRQRPSDIIPTRIEHQADLLLSTLARYVDGMGGEMSLLIRFSDQQVVELNPSLSELGAESASSNAVAELRRYSEKEDRFRDVAAA